MGAHDEHETAVRVPVYVEGSVRSRRLSKFWGCFTHSSITVKRFLLMDVKATESFCKQALTVVGTPIDRRIRIAPIPCVTFVELVVERVIVPIRDRRVRREAYGLCCSPVERNTARGRDVLAEIWDRTLADTSSARGVFNGLSSTSGP